MSLECVPTTFVQTCAQQLRCFNNSEQVSKKAQFFFSLRFIEMAKYTYSNLICLKINIHPTKHSGLKKIIKVITVINQK